MPEILVARQLHTEITDADREAVRRVIFGAVDGVGAREAKRWRRFWSHLLRMEPGEIARVAAVFERSTPYHRRHFAIEQAVFEAQDRFVEFEQFRVWVKVGSGWVAWVAGPKGGVIPLPRSVSYRKADQIEFEEFHAAVMAFFRGEYAADYLWPHLKGAKADQMMDSILSEFEE